jgi:S1-C subfamily serine protease
MRYFIRLRGREDGPFDIDELRRMRAQGRFSPIHEVSTDRMYWNKASVLSEVFSSHRSTNSAADHYTDSPTPQRAVQATYGAVPSPQPGPAVDSPPKPDTQPIVEPQWFYSLNGKSHGPFALGVLCECFRNLHLDGETQVWSPAHGDWRLAADVPAIAAVLTPEPRRGKRILLFGSIVAVLLVAAMIFLFYDFAPAQERVIKRASPSVALVNTRTGSGSGFLVSQKVLVTNRHVIEDELENFLEVFFPSDKGREEKAYKAHILYEDDKLDLAFLSVETDLRALPLGQPSAFAGGAEVVVIGSPASRVADSTTGNNQIMLNAPTWGRMSTEVNHAGKKYYHLDVTVNPGNSGGPALNAKGAVVGVVDFTDPSNTRQTFVIPVSEVSADLDKLNGLSEKEKAVNQANHQAKVFFVGINKASSQRIVLLAKFVQKELKEDEVTNDKSLKIFDQCLTELWLPHLPALFSSDVLTGGIRTNLKLFQENYTDLKQVQHDLLTKGISEDTANRFVKLIGDFRSQRTALTALLGEPIADQLNKRK